MRVLWQHCKQLDKQARNIDKYYLSHVLTNGVPNFLIFSCSPTTKPRAVSIARAHGYLQQLWPHTRAFLHQALKWSGGGHTPGPRGAAGAVDGGQGGGRLRGQEGGRHRGQEGGHPAVTVPRSYWREGGPAAMFVHDWRVSGYRSVIHNKLPDKEGFVNHSRHLRQAYQEFPGL